jgi:2-dehydro-3-deoxyphosphooctonate aldolase (KDO 8-P synthase)
VDGLFLEVHDNPGKALSDGANALPLERLGRLLARLKELSALARRWDAVESER